MKELVMDILEDFENQVPMDEIAMKVNLTVDEVMEIVDEWSSDRLSSWYCC